MEIIITFAFMQKMITIYGFLLVSYVAYSQHDETYLQLDSLLVKLHDVIYLQKDIEIEEIKGVYRLTAWHFLPNLNYDFINNNYYVTVSSGPIISNMINKRQETRRLSALDRRYDNQIKSSEIRLKQLYLSLHQRITNLQLSHEIVLNDVEIFKIKLQQHVNHEIDTETFLRERSTILNKIRSHNSDITEIQRSLYEIELLTETELQIDLSRFIVPPPPTTPTP